MNKNSSPCLSALALLIATPLAHSANLSLLVTDSGGNQQLSSFDSALGAGSRVDNFISGLAPGESLVGLDYRPANGVVYAISSSSNIYTINTTNGAATQLGATLSPGLIGSTYGFDYNPVLGGGQFARIISDTDNNRVIDGSNGGYLGSVEKTAVFYATGDTNEGINPNINHIAYTNSVVGASATQQFGIDTGLDILTTVANNAGTLNSVGSLGLDASEFGGFDIEGSTGEAFAAFQNGDGSSTLYNVNLGTGQATSLFSFQGNVLGLTTVPEPSSALLLGLSGLALILRRKR